MKIPKGHLPQADHEAIIRALAQSGTEKITFVGGEPTLCPWLPDLIKLTKSLGMTTMIVTNGTRLDEAYFQILGEALDWVTLSIDSLDANILKQIGRWNPQQLKHPEFFYREKINLIRTHGVRLKINTVVCRFNVKENLSRFIEGAAPERWKIFQALPVMGQNDQEFDDLNVTPDQFLRYVARQRVPNGISMVVEDNEAMTGSYVMIDPAGRFYDNVGGTHHYSSPILEKGLHAAFQEVCFDQNQFLQRNGYWNWT
jgi:radical S-adenosyl methionine domain-containing protein 2